MQLLLATVISLLAVANGVINFYAEKIWKHKEFYNRSKYDTTINLNVDDPTCCFGTCHEASKDANESQRYHENGNLDKFVSDFIGLDGEALKWAAEVLHKAHDSLSDDVKAQVQVSVKRNASQYIRSPEEQGMLELTTAN